MISLAHCQVHFTPQGAQVVFPDDKAVMALPDWEDFHYKIIAMRLGYEYDLLRYCQEHELAHCFVAEKLFDAPSFVLRRIAEGKMPTGAEAAYEECFAQTWQRYVRTGERPILSGLPFDQWKKEWNDLFDVPNWKMTQ